MNVNNSITSYVDPVINAVVMSQIDLRGDMFRLLQGDLSPRLLNTFLHEVTHHWCFMSPLGNALALLRMRAYRRAAVTLSGERDESSDLLDDVMRQQATVEMLRPLAEGLACFMELDAVPGNASVISGPMVAACMHFGGVENRKNGELDRTLFYLLYETRLHTSSFQRRENILASRFGLEEGGYLAGYLSVKNLWNFARTHVVAAADADLFACFLRSFIYDDYAFVAVVLDPSACEGDAVNIVANYFLSRVRTFLSMDLEAAFAEYEKSYLAGEVEEKRLGSLVGRHGKLAGLGIDADQAQLGKERLLALVSELFECDDSIPLMRMAMDADLKRFHKREMFCIASLDGQARVNEFGRVLFHAVMDGKVDEMPTMAVEGINGISIGEASGTLEVYFIPMERARVVVISRGAEVVFVEFSGKIDDDRKAQIQERLSPRRDDLIEIGSQEKVLQAVIEDNPIAAYFFQKLNSDMQEPLEEIYLWMATLGVKTECWEDVARDLRIGGIFQVMEEDVSFLTGLSFLGAVTTITSEPDEIKELALKVGIDLAYTLKRAAELESRRGVRTVLQQDGFIHCLL